MLELSKDDLLLVCGAGDDQKSPLLGMLIDTGTGAGVGGILAIVNGSGGNAETLGTIMIGASIGLISVIIYDNVKQFMVNRSTPPVQVPNQVP